MFRAFEKKKTRKLSFWSNFLLGLSWYLSDILTCTWSRFMSSNNWFDHNVAFKVIHYFLHVWRDLCTEIVFTVYIRPPNVMRGWDKDDSNRTNLFCSLTFIHANPGGHNHISSSYSHRYFMEPTMEKTRESLSYLMPLINCINSECAEYMER